MRFKIWDAMHNWLERISKTLDKKFPKLSIGPILFSLDLSELPVYENLPETPPSNSDPLIEVFVDHDKSTVTLAFKEPFLYHMNNPINVSERELVLASLKGFSELADLGIDDQEIINLCDTIVPNQHARHIHIFKAYRFRDVIRAYDECKSARIENFDAAFLKIGLGHIDGATGAREITGKNECVSFLNRVVAYAWEQLKNELKKYNRQSLIVAALRNIEGIASEKDQWDRTSRAVLGLHNNQDDVHQARMKEFSNFYGADLASRILVETAVCECPLEGGYEVGRLDLSPLMARASLLFHLGNLSDAVEKGVTEPRIVISGNGEIKYEHAFYDNIIVPFSDQFEKTSLQSSAQNYEEHFEEMPQAKSPADVFQDDFLTAFEKEIGIGVEPLRNFRETMENMAVEKEAYVFTAKQSEILEYCEESELSNKEEALKALKGYSLCPRPKWEKPPSGYKSRDINPWLFRRRLSLLLKPYVRIDDGDDPTYIISPGISSQALGYTLGVYWRGNIEEDRCSSSEMKGWIGNERRRKGRDFTQKVASALSDLGYTTQEEVNISSIIPQKELDQDYGDVDILAWNEKVIYLIECKDLYHAKTVKEVAEQLLEFKGKLRDGKPDKLKRHIDRAAILTKNKDKLLKFCGLLEADADIVAYVIFSNPVPILYDQSREAQDIKLTYLQDVKDNGLNQS